MPHCFNTLHGLYVLNYFEANIKIYLDDNLETQSNYNVFMMTASNGNNFRVTGPLCREFTGHRWIPLTKASDVELWCFFDVRLNKRLNKQSWGWWFEMPPRSLWRHHNVAYFSPAGQGDMAVSNAVGSNVFDILLCMGLPWFLRTAVIDPGSTVIVYSEGKLEFL